jgi:arginyl-tRNA synthetase
MSRETIESILIKFIEASARLVLEDLGVNSASSTGLKIELEIPRERAHGDLSTNTAMRMAKEARQSPLNLANMLAKKMSETLGTSKLAGVIDRIEAKAPGFVNFFLARSYLDGLMLDIENKKADYGRSDFGALAKLQIEFVSANPTGPLTIAHGRQAAIGDSLANILEFAGYNVTREYYLNDEGNQMNVLGASVRMRYRELCGIKEDFLADGYNGGYVYDIAASLKKAHGDKYKDEADIEIFREFGMSWLMADIREDLDAFGVKFDVWYSQKSLRESGKVEDTIKILKEKGHIFEEEGAVWFRSTSFGDDKDRVIIKSDGSMTYLTPDIAYHEDKFKRGFSRIIDIWGPDHHGYVPRMKAAVQALGHPVDSISVLIVQLATLYKGGKQVSMSTRAGEFITLREVREEVGKDVARFCFIMRRISSHLDFDLDIVKSQSMENPVYYIQYAHARIWSILEHGNVSSVSTDFNSSLLKEPEELELLRVLRQFPLVVVMASKSLEPYTVLQYLQDLAGLFHSFYAKHRVVGDDPELTKARLVLMDCIKIVLANGLKLLGVSLPKKM